MDNCNVQQETQDKLQHYHRRVENIQRSVLVDVLLIVRVDVVRCWLCGVVHILQILISGPKRFLMQVDDTTVSVCSTKAEHFKAAQM